jgi:hypothetical protein
MVEKLPHRGRLRSIVGALAPFEYAARLQRAAAPIRDDLRRRFHFVLWSLLVLAAAALVWSEARNVPYWDEWENVPYVAGERAQSAEWLWSLHAQHRLLLPRLVYVGLMRITSGDFRAAPWMNLILLAISAWILLDAVVRARGESRWSDALIPLVLLHWGHAENVLWGFQIAFVLGTALFCVLAAAILRCARPLRCAQVLGVAVPLLLLPLTGGTGFALAAGFAPWLVAIAFLALRARGERAAGALALVAACALTVLLVVYARGSEAMRPRLPPASGYDGAVWDALAFLAGGIGPAASAWHPLLTIATGVLLAATVALLSRKLWLERARAPIEAGLLFLLIAQVFLALVVALGRTPGMNDEMFVPRYVTIAAPLWCVLHLAWSWSDRGARLSRFVSPALALAVALAFPINAQNGLARAVDRSQRLHAFEMDAWSGSRPAELAARHAGFVYPSDRAVEGSQQRLAQQVATLERARLGPFSLDAEQRWDALHREYLEFLIAHQSQPWIPILLDGDEECTRFALLSPAPGRILLHVTPGRWTLRGCHGMRRDAWELGRSDGVVFTVVVRVSPRPDEDRVIYRRWLRPADEFRDRGPQPFDAPIETAKPAVVVLLTDPGPAQDARFDSSYWTDLALVPAE